MKRINCFIPYGKIEATRQTVAQLAESSLVSQIYLITDRSPRQGYLSLQFNPHGEYMEHEDPPGNSRLCQCHYTLIYTKTEELQLGMYA